MACRAGAVFAALLLVSLPLSAAAEESTHEKELRKELDDLKAELRRVAEQVKQQQELIEKLTASKPPPTEERKSLEAEIAAAMPTPVAETPKVQPAVGAGVGKSSSLLNPDISLNGDFTFLGTDDRQLAKANRFSFREAELGVQAPIDPYARADVFLTWGEGESPEVEEAYATFLALPYNLQARVGKFRLSFGKNNTLHRHALSQTDRPLVEAASLGEEGVSGTGAGVSWLVPNPWDQYLLLTGEVANGLGEELEEGQGTILERPAAARSFGDFVYVGHAQSFFDLDDSQNLELGGSILATEPRSGPRLRMYGVDLTYRWRPLDQAGFHQFIWRTEGYFTHQDSRVERPSVFDTGGFYSYGEYRLTQSLWVGNRFDWTEIPGTSGEKEWGVFPYFTYSPMEFGYVRLGYQFVRSDRIEGEDSNRFWLQYNFSIGPHAAHAF